MVTTMITKLGQDLLDDKGYGKVIDKAKGHTDSGSSAAHISKLHKSLLKKDLLTDLGKKEDPNSSEAILSENMFTPVGLKRVKKFYNLS